MQKNNWKIKDRFSSVQKLAKNSVYRQAALAGLTVLLTLVLIFAMSAAWYTNVVKTGDLVFQVEQWGFTGSVQIDDVPILAAPGDSGVIGLSMNNTGSDLVVADVSILKSTMSTDMQKRLYFYADTSAVIEGETVERVYLNSRESYAYNIFSQGVLNLSETVYNDVQLKWCWVYDVLGYYVLGTRDPQTNKVQVAEYLQPVEYAYDEAKTTFDNNGKLLTIDGKTTVAQFLSKLSEHDGYAGTFTVDEKKWTEEGFYPVSVDANGTGVWVKLLSYSEIEKEIITDTAMGSSQETIQAKARLTITAENVMLETTNVTGTAQLQELINTDGTVVLQLSENLAVQQQITVPSNTQAILNLNGYTVTGAANTTTFHVEEGGSLTLMDGIMESTGGTAITGAGAEITLSNLDITGYETVVNVRDNKSKTDSTVRVVDCDVNTSDVTFYLWGNGNTTKTASRLILENTRAVSDYIPVCGNGNDDSWGTDIQVISSTLDGKWAGIYHPQRGSAVTVSAGSTITGYTGIAMKGGSLYAMDSTVTGTGAYGAAQYQKSGFSDTGDGIYVEANYGHDILVEVRGNSVVTGTQSKTYAVQVYEPNADNVTVRIFGGTFSTDVERFLADGCAQTQKDGKFVVK